MNDTQAVAMLNAVLRLYPNAQPTLTATTPFEILVAVMLSAQTTDVAVNAVTPKLFAAYPDAAHLAQATVAQIEPYIDRLGLYHVKAQHLQAMSQQLDSEFGGAVPGTRAELMALPGVGQKTATVVLTDAFGVPGIAVDTHVTRIIRGFGIVGPTATPTQIQAKLEALMPEDTWINLHRALIRLGREWLTARHPQLPPGADWAAFGEAYAPLKEG
ncbi:endonuclease III domain-containing protein [Lacticaseibacillus nasuensis]|uniref:Endonuclease III n=1 Tax=Lacticaseibacillus nasuensis JCM 17158 TaxID=1291734 RepID=A0A0R1JZP9_9LACO|nr:endonuclease III [Lacticaseibacillus nasuensis]KRK73298.1 endonuclease III [Lacticaseibacillus nasuensis JCM 17158]